MRLIIRSKNIYGFGVGIYTVSEMLSYLNCMGLGMPLGTQSVSLNASYHNEQKIIYVLGARFRTVSGILSLICTRSGGAYPRRPTFDDTECIFLKRKSNIYARTWFRDRVLKSFIWTKGSFPRVTHCRRHWMRLIIRNNNINGLGMRCWTRSIKP